MACVVKMVDNFESLVPRNVVFDADLPRVLNLTVFFSKGVGVTSADVVSFPADVMALLVKMVDSYGSFLFVKNVVFEVDFPRVSNLTVVFSKWDDLTTADVLSFRIDVTALLVKMVNSFESLVLMNVAFM